MKNIIIYLSIVTPALLSGCLGEKLISTSNDYYKQGNDMVCVNHSSNVEKGSLVDMLSARSMDNITLVKKAPRKSCVVFSFENDKITATSTKNESIEIKPYQIYGFSTNIYNYDGISNEASGHGPNICFTQDEQKNYQLHLQNFNFRSINLKQLGCQ